MHVDDFDDVGEISQRHAFLLFSSENRITIWCSISLSVYTILIECYWSMLNMLISNFMGLRKKMILLYCNSLAHNTYFILYTSTIGHKKMYSFTKISPKSLRLHINQKKENNMNFFYLINVRAEIGTPYSIYRYMYSVMRTHIYIYILYNRKSKYSHNAFAIQYIHMNTNTRLLNNIG